GAPSDSVQIKSISVSRTHPRSAELTVTVDLEVVECLPLYLSLPTPERLLQEGATADVLVKYRRIKLLQQTFDICEEACPTRRSRAPSSGAYSIVQTVELPKEVPKPALKYVINVYGYTVVEDPMACADITVSSSRSS
ncbi:hypothetical protein DFH08DRAFT_687635, partial [Mycena albidolilacea]